MTYGELVDIYFGRSNALQWYWTVYVVVIGGLLAFSSLRQWPDPITGILVTVLYVCFAYKNLGAIRDVSYERYAILDLIKATPQVENAAPQAGREVLAVRQAILPVLNPPEFKGVRNFHIGCDFLTVAALWGMELRRKRAWVVRTTGPATLMP